MERTSVQRKQRSLGFFTSTIPKGEGRRILTQEETRPARSEAKASLSPLGFFLVQRNQNRIRTRLFIQSVCRTADSAKKERAK